MATIKRRFQYLQYVLSIKTAGFITKANANTGYLILSWISIITIAYAVVFSVLKVFNVV